MRFATWLKRQERGTRAKMMRALGAHATALARAQRGLPISWVNAKRISDMTDSVVSVAELCEPAGCSKRGVR